jgi:hypothetical protein
MNRKLRRLLYRLSLWFTAHQLVFCVRCRRLLWERDAEHEYTTTGILAALCHECHVELFEPFGGKK